LNPVPKRVWQLLTSWPVVTSSGAMLAVAGVVLWTVTQAPISLAQTGSSGYGGVSAASTSNPTTPTTGAGLVAPAIVLLVGMIVFGVGLYLRRSSAQTTS